MKLKVLAREARRSFGFPGTHFGAQSIGILRKSNVFGARSAPVLGVSGNHLQAKSLGFLRKSTFRRLGGEIENSIVTFARLFMI